MQSGSGACNFSTSPPHRKFLQQATHEFWHFTICPIAVATSWGLLCDEIVIFWNKTNTPEYHVWKWRSDWESHTLASRNPFQNLQLRTQLGMTHLYSQIFHTQVGFMWNWKNHLILTFDAITNTFQGLDGTNEVSFCLASHCRSIHLCFFSKKEKANKYWQLCEEEK